MNSGLGQALFISLLYTLLIFMIAWYAHYRKLNSRSIVNNPLIYTLSLAVYCTSWTYYGSVGRAATNGIDFILIYIGPSLTAFSWFFILRRITKISKDNNITSIADFISLRYGKSLFLGALVTILVVIGLTPYIALQIKAVTTSFQIISSFSYDLAHTHRATPKPTNLIGLILALILSIFSVVFGARKLDSTERHEGLIAAVALESLVKLASMITVGILVTYIINDGFLDIFLRFKRLYPISFNRLFTLRSSFSGDGMIHPFTILFLSMGAIMLLPRQFHVMVTENCNENHIYTAMWCFPLYLFIINLFIMPLALYGIIATENTQNSDYFVLTLPLMHGYHTTALLAYLGGISAAAGMVMVESVTISTMLLNYIFMPVIVRFTPQYWFPYLLINLKRLSIFTIIFLGYFYFVIAGENFTLFKLGLISFSAVIQLLPAIIGGLFWKRGNRVGAIIGVMSGLAIWLYTIFWPTIPGFPWYDTHVFKDLLSFCPLLDPLALFGLSGLDPWSHCLFWSMFLNTVFYVTCSVIFRQSKEEQKQAEIYCGSFFMERRHRRPPETTRTIKPVTISQFKSLMAKFIGDQEANIAISKYVKDHKIDQDGTISEFDIQLLKLYTEKTLAGSIGAAAAGAIVDSFLSDMGSRMELVYDIFSTVRISLDQSREALSVRLKASEIINQTTDLSIIMDNLLDLILNDFNLDMAVVALHDKDGKLRIVSLRGKIVMDNIMLERLYKDSCTFAKEDFKSKSIIFNYTSEVNTLTATNNPLPNFSSFAHIPIIREGESCLGVLSLFSYNFSGFFTNEFINLLESLTGQLAQAITIAREIKAKEYERCQKEEALLQNAKIKRDMEIARQIQLSLLPNEPPSLYGVELWGTCISAAHVGGDYFDYFLRDNNTIDILVADVSGHSVGAALIMAELRTLLRPHINSAYNACTTLKLLNSQLYDDLTRAESLITVFYAKYNSATGRLSYANAGHNRPIVCREENNKCIELDAEGLVIGVRPSVIFEERSLELIKGDVVLFYTDGLVEAMDPDGIHFGINRVCLELQAMRHLPAKNIIDTLYSAVYEHAGNSNLQDDISMVVLKII